MSQYCGDECEPLCDFCINFAECIETEDWHSDGICLIDGKEVSRIDACEENFHYFRCKEVNDED